MKLPMESMYLYFKYKLGEWKFSMRFLVQDFYFFLNLVTVLNTEKEQSWHIESWTQEMMAIIIINPWVPSVFEVVEMQLGTKWLDTETPIWEPDRTEMLFLQMHTVSYSS